MIQGVYSLGKEFGGSGSFTHPNPKGDKHLLPLSQAGRTGVGGWFSVKGISFFCLRRRVDAISKK